MNLIRVLIKGPSSKEQRTSGYC